MGRPKKALYGLRDSLRLWQWYLLKFLAGKVDARVLVSERNAIKWRWCGILPLMVMHVEEVFFTPSAPEIQ
jgi:hypothetical protein